MRTHKSSPTIFSQPRRFFVILENQFIRYPLLNSPFIILLISILIYNKFNLKLIGLYPDTFDFNNILLFGDTIALVLISSVTYFYKEVLLKIIDDDEILGKIKKIIEKIEIIGVDKEKSKVESITFGNKSVSDYNVLLKHSNTTFRIMHRNIYCLEFILIFLSLALATFDFLFKECFFIWKYLRFYYMFGVNFFILVSIVFHCFIVLFQYKLKEGIKNSVTEGNIKDSWKRYMEESSKIGNVGSIAKEVEEFRQALGC